MSQYIRIPPAEQVRRITKHHRGTRHRPAKHVPVTGRSARYYQAVLYPEAGMLPQIRRQGGRLLDLGSGCNHLYRRSLLWKLRRRGGRALGLDSDERLDEETRKAGGSTQYRRGSLFGTGLPARSFGTILSNNVLYYWIDTQAGLLRAYRELVRLLRPGGEVRIFPVFYGNYHMNSPELHRYLHQHFWVRLLTPRRYPAESPIMLFDGEVQATDPAVGQGERRMMRRLQAQTLVLRRAS